MIQKTRHINGIPPSRSARLGTRHRRGKLKFFAFLVGFPKFLSENKVSGLQMMTGGMTD
jgi:hypothetical protein